MNKDEIKSLLLRNDRAVERAMVVLFECQTNEEQSSHTTKIQNGKGFSAFHANTGTYFAKWILQGKQLSGKHLAKARKMSMFYASQLADMAERKAAGQ